jgi:acetoin utilization deacetylase AcuC-like enzyme
LRLRDRLRRRLRRRRPLPTWYDPAYRLPLDGPSAIDTRRADRAVWYLVDARTLRSNDLLVPPRISYDDLALVHTPAYLDSLSDARTLARIFAADEADLPVDEVLRTVRLATGGTLAAARAALRRSGPSVNLLGGFHHAAPDQGGGLCAVNDVAVAIARLRKDGLRGRIAVLDLDAHPPDGLAACLHADEDTWIGSLSGVAWTAGFPRQVDETLVAGVTDARYLAALDDLLSRMPRPRLTFVIAGGDVITGDRLGHVGLSLGGVRARDLHVVAALDGIPSVWLPGGGYSDRAWRVLAGTLVALVERSPREVPDGDPMRLRFSAISRGLPAHLLADEDELSLADLEADLGGRRAAHPRLLGFYTAEGIELALSRFGLLAYLERLGFPDCRVQISTAAAGGERVLLLSGPHVLVECVLARQRLGDKDFLYVHWLTLRNPLARFGPHRRPLPGQDVPGLGVAREVGELLARIASRLGLAGVAFRPAWYHTAYVARHDFRFLDPVRQERFEALVRHLGEVPLLEATHAVAAGQVILDGAPVRWEPDVMVFLLESEKPS